MIKEFVHIKIVKMGASQVIMFSEDGKIWEGVEKAFNLHIAGDYDLRLVIEQGPNVVSIIPNPEGGK